MAEREVVYRIRYEVDPRSAQTMQDLARQAEATQKQITQTQQREVAERDRQTVAGSTLTQAEMTRAHAAWVQRRVDNERRIMADHLSHQKLVAQTHAELMQRIQLTAAQEMERGSRLALRGMEQLGRGLVILKALDEDTAQSALRLIGGFEMLAQIGKGLHNTFIGVARSLEAYSASARAAAIATAALNSAQTGGNIAGGAAAAARGGGGGLRGLAGMGISAAAAGAATPAGLIGVPLAAFGGAWLVNQSLTDHWTAPGTDMKAGGWGSFFGGGINGSGGFGWESGAGFAGANAMLGRMFANDDIARMDAESGVARQSAIGSLASQRDAALAGVSGMSAGAANSQAIAAARGRVGGALGRFNAAMGSNATAGASLATQTGAIREEVQARQELVRLTQQQYTIEMDRIAATRKASDDALKNAKTLADSFRAIRDMEMDRVKGAEQRFGSLDPLQRQSVLRAAKKAQSGEELSEADTRLLDQFSDLGNLGGAIQRSRAARAKRGGFDELSKLTGADQRAAAAAFFATDAEVGARGVIQAQTEIRVKLDADAKALGTQIANELRTQFKELEAAMLKQLETERRQRQQERNVSAAKARAAAGE